VELEGLDEELRPALDATLEVAALQVGDRYSREAKLDTAGDIARALRELSHAKVRVTSRVEVTPDEHAVDVTYTVEPSPPCRFGAVTISGHDRVPLRLIEDELSTSEGAAFSSDALASDQIRLFGLGVFSLVKVVPDLTGERDVVPVHIELSEVTFHEVRVGAGFGIEAGEQLARPSVRYTNSNVGYRLWTFETEAAAGHQTFSSRVLPQGSDLDTNNAGVFAIAETSLVLPRFPSRSLEPRLDVVGELGRDIQSTYLRALAGPALTWRFTPRHQLTVGYHLERWTGVLDGAIQAAERIRQDVDLYNTKPLPASRGLKVAKVQTTPGSSRSTR